MATKIDRNGLVEAYTTVRDDAAETNWALCGYQDNEVVVTDTGSDYDSFLEKISDDERQFAYVRITTGDEMSKRSKFVFITWAGANVSSMKKAKMSVDKGFVKSVFTNFAVEILANEKSDLQLSKVEDIARKAGGAAYGTGK